MAQVSLKNLGKRYGKVEIIHSIDLEVIDNEFLVLVGPSGCGKSTILRMVAGLEDISNGEIWIGDRIVNDLPPKERDIAMVFQNYALYPHMNVEQNISFGLKLQKRPQHEIKEKIENAARILGLHDLLKRKPAELSGGQRQRVAMGRAIVRNPKVFLFDEPLSNLDAKLRTQMRAEIKRLHQRVQSTIIYVTHDQVEAMTLADRIVIMKDGFVEQVGTPAEVFQRPSNIFVAGFIGSPSMNLIPAKITEEKGDLYLAVNSSLKIPIPNKKGQELKSGQEVVFGIRSEDVGILLGEDKAEWSFGGKVDVIEPLGGETLLHLEVEEAKLIAKCDGRIQLTHGSDIKMTFNLNRLHVFDAQTQKNIY
jgi:multiple sugar transport system ATP-binding protein